MQTYFWHQQISQKLLSDFNCNNSTLTIITEVNNKEYFIKKIS